MQISEIRIKLVENRSDRLKAFCSVTFDNSFVIRDLKIIEGTDAYFVAMPSRKLMDRCPACGSKNHLRAKFCNECGARLDENRLRRRNVSGRTKLHADVAHPINQEGREYIQSEIVKAYESEVELAKQPGYQPPSMDFDEDYPGQSRAAPAPPPQPEAAPTPAPPSEEEQKKPNPEFDPTGFSEGL